MFSFSSSDPAPLNQVSKALRASTVLILPGYGGSGADHWQTLWELSDQRFRRVSQRDWERPERLEWVEGLEEAVKAAGTDTILVAHSLACLQVAHWSTLPVGSTSLVRGALLVAPPDPESPPFPPVANSFAPIPMTQIPFPTILVCSTNDPYATPVFSDRCARAWGSRLVSIGEAGHINAASGIGEWPEGKGILEQLAENR